MPVVVWWAVELPELLIAAAYHEAAVNRPTLCKLERAWAILDWKSSPSSPRCWRSGRLRHP